VSQSPCSKQNGLLEFCRKIRAKATPPSLHTPVPATAMTKGIEKHLRRAAMRCLRYVAHMVAKDGRGLKTGGHEWHVTSVVRLPAVA